MQSILVINSKIYPEHKGFGETYRSVLEHGVGPCTVIDTGDEAESLHEKFYRIQNASPKWIMSFDLAGFESRTSLRGPAFNLIPCRMAHLLLREPELPGVSDDAGLLSDDPINFSMFFYTAREAWARQMRENYQSIEHIGWLPGLEDPGRAKEMLRKIFDDTEMALDFTECRQFGTE